LELIFISYFPLVHYISFNEKSNSKYPSAINSEYLQVFSPSFLNISKEARRKSSYGLFENVASTVAQVILGSNDLTELPWHC